MAIVAGLFAVTGTGFSLVSRLGNDGKVCGRCAMTNSSLCATTWTSGSA